MPIDIQPAIKLKGGKEKNKTSQNIKGRGLLKSKQTNEQAIAQKNPQRLFYQQTSENPDNCRSADCVPNYLRFSGFVIVFMTNEELKQAEAEDKLCNEFRQENWIEWAEDCGAYQDEDGEWVV